MLEEDASQVGWDGLFEDGDSAEEITVNLIAAGGIEASPTPGTVSAGTEITLTSVPDSFDIHYTTDGSEPTLSSPIYDNNNKIVVNGDTEIKAFAKKDGFLIGPVKNFIYNN